MAASTINDRRPHLGAPFTLRFKLTLFVVSVILLAATLVGWMGYVFARQTLREQIEQRLRIVAADRRDMLLAYVHQQHERVGLVASRTQLRRIAEQLRMGDSGDAPFDADQLRADAESILSDAKTSTSGFIDIALFDESGQLLAATTADAFGEEVATSDEFEIGKSTRHLGLPRMEEDRFVSLLTAPAKGNTEELLGVIVVKLDVTPLKNLLSNPEGLGDTGEVRVGHIDGEKARYLFPTRAEGKTRVQAKSVPAFAKAVSGEQGFMVTHDERGQDVFAIYESIEFQPSSERPFGMVAKFDVTEALAPVVSLRNLLLATNAALLIAGVLTAWWFARRITNPLVQLARDVDATTAGDLSEQVRVSSRDETGALAIAFNNMTRKLRESYVTLERRVEQRTRELTEATTALGEQAERTRRIIDTATDAFVAMNAGGNIVDWNPAAEHVFGWKRDEIVDKPVADVLVPPTSRQAHRDGLRHFLETGEGPVLNRLIEVTALHRDGHEFPIELTISPLVLGDTVVFNAFIHDITERKRAEETLMIAKAAAEDASRAKSDFLANMSHEIRTPMNAIIGMTELVLDTDIDQTQREYLETVLDSAEHLLTIINEILDFSKIEAGRVQLENCPFHLRDALGDTMKVMAFRAHHKQLELAFRVAQEVPEGIISDPVRLRQIVINLVGNAIKFTQEGEVLLEVSVQRQHDERNLELQFSVCDTGIGIPQAQIENVFESFTQADSSTTRKYGGTGLGLSICQRLIEMMGGRIWVESVPGEGSQFHFTVPVVVADDFARSRPYSSEQLEGLRVLAVDDNATNRRILADMLKSWGIKAVMADSAAQAIEEFREAGKRREPFSLILTDLQMPTMDGLELVEQIRKTAGSRQPEVIVLTSGERPGNVKRCQELNVAAFLMKPVKQSELLNEILASTGQHEVVKEPAVASEDPFPAQTPPLKILVAEDGQSNRRLLEALLQKWGHQVRFAFNGLEVLSQLASDDFDVVLMDIEMPQMDGLEATRRIRRLSDGKRRVPIVALTAHAMAGDEQRCLAAGMDGYVCKPIRAADLSRVLYDLASSGGRVTDDVAEKAEYPPEMGMNGVDLDAAREALGGDEDLLRIIVSAFLDESPKLLDSLQNAAKSVDMDGLRMAAHALKGAIRYFGETDAYRLAYELESGANAGQIEDLSGKVEQLSNEVTALREFLSQAIDGDTNGKS